MMKRTAGRKKTFWVDISKEMVNCVSSVIKICKTSHFESQLLEVFWFKCRANFRQSISSQAQETLSLQMTLNTFVLVHEDILKSRSFYTKELTVGNQI